MANYRLSSASEIGAGLRRARESAGLSQAVIGARLGLREPHGQSHVSQIESGGAGRISFEMFVRYAYACLVSPSVLLAELEQAGVFTSLRADVAARATRQIEEPGAGPGGAATEVALPSPRQLRRRRANEDRDVLHLLEAECAPVIQPHLAESKVVRYGTFRWAMRQFQAVWKRLSRTAGGAEREALLRRELDAIVEQAVEFGLPRAGMEQVRDRAIELLSAISDGLHCH